jgi:hypothetical protein
MRISITLSILLFILSIHLRFTLSSLLLNTNHAIEKREWNRFYDSAQCSNLESDAHYLDHVILYKDNVESISECCEFCNLNPACNVWSLQIEFKRCFLKSTRGARLGDTGYISGFSDKCKYLFIFLANHFFF